MNSIFFQIGNIQIYWYSILLCLGFIVGGYFAMKEAKKKKIPEDDFVNMCFYLVIFALIGARLYYIFFNLEYYSQNLLDIIKVWEGGLAIHGGIIAGIIYLFYFYKKKNWNLFVLTDIFSVSLIIGQAIGRWGNFFNSEAHGAITTLEHLQNLHLPNFIIEGMHIGSFYYEPTFLYESLWCLIGFFLLYKIRNHAKIGITTAIYCIWYGVERFFVEGMRTDSLMIGSMKMAQMISIIGVIVGICLIIYIYKRKNIKLYKEAEIYDKL